VEEELACSRWLSMNDNLAYRKVLGQWGGAEFEGE